ncbi:hypothetical protein ACT1U9_11205 [Streptomyces sp. BR1]|uniref:hypothetical protein n=1 Tax=Streptomyces sp. BR1 TaxID=1592323 RepID=UPI00402B9970
MPIARRPLLTATAAGSLLCALWFVPSANATDAPGKPQPAPAHSSATASGTEADPALADTGSVDTSPYLFGGTLFLGVGAGFVAFSVRRARRQY